MSLLPCIIGYDARTLRMGHGGIPTYARGLLGALDNSVASVQYGNETQLPYRFRNPLYRLWYEQVLLPRRIKKDAIGIYHGLRGVMPFSLSIPSIVTAHDLYIYQCPEVFSARDGWYNKMFLVPSFRRADHIIAVSDATKQVLQEYLNISEDRITVIHEGCDQQIFRVYSKQERDIVLTKLFGYAQRSSSPTKKILSFASMQANRRWVDVVSACREILSHQDDVEMWFVDRSKTSTERKIIQEMIRSLGYTDRVRFIPSVSDKELAVLYSSADVFVFSSVYEGFGLPLLEALSCGCTVVCSDIAVFKEIGRDVVIMYPVGDVDVLVSTVVRTLGSNEYASLENCQKRIAHASTFSWQQCAQKTVEVYKKFCV